MGRLKDELSKRIERQEEELVANRIAHSSESQLLDYNIICIHPESEDLSSLECTDDDDIECLEYVKGLIEINTPDSAITQPPDGASVCNLSSANDGIANSQVSLTNSFVASESAFKDIASNASDVASQIESTNEAIAAVIEGFFEDFF